MAGRLASLLPAVLGGVALATVVNHGLAVAVGGSALLVVPVGWVRIGAALSFIGFDLWTFRGDRLVGNEEKPLGSPLVTVAVSFFLAEMGDKTRLPTAVLAAQATHLAPVWLGSVLGMVAADGLAVLVGALLGARLPERALKFGAATLLVVIGVVLLFEGVSAV
jgi:Ca2+/H+ antiporter, TMEM165/GDT1 family